MCRCNCMHKLSRNSSRSCPVAVSDASHVCRQRFFSPNHFECHSQHTDSQRWPTGGTPNHSRQYSSLSSPANTSPNYLIMKILHASHTVIHCAGDYFIIISISQRARVPLLCRRETHLDGAWNKTLCAVESNMCVLSVRLSAHKIATTSCTQHAYCKYRALCVDV